jgi:peptide/nickel transport system ATP-binding protein|tara:strand:+ start:346 stop:1161 length:816 start_codon:yes stop_codon:yes gene_type:complete
VPSVVSLQGVSAYYPTSSDSFFVQSGWTRILEDISFQLSAGEILSIVGESGSGKSTLGKSIVGLVPKISGTFAFRSKTYNPLDMDHLREHIQIIFQDPYSSMNPMMTVSETLEEVIRLYPKTEELNTRMSRLLDRANIPKDALTKYPHELSGGQRQRVCIARSLAVEPEVLICDEIVSALDVSVQAKILNLLKDLAEQKSIAILFTTHDLHVVESFADNVLVMTKGKIAESGSVEDIFQNPANDYTKSLLEAVPGKNHAKESEILMPSSSS